MLLRTDPYRERENSTVYILNLDRHIYSHNDIVYPEHNS